MDLSTPNDHARLREIEAKPANERTDMDRAHVAWMSGQGGYSVPRFYTGVAVGDR